jgi:hypothetical protein
MKSAAFSDGNGGGESEGEDEVVYISWATCMQGVSRRDVPRIEDEEPHSLSAGL